MDIHLSCCKARTWPVLPVWYLGFTWYCRPQAEFSDAYKERSDKSIKTFPAMAQFAANFVAHTRMQNVLSTVKITIRTRLRQGNFIIQVVFWNLTSCPVEGARTFL